MVADTNHLGSNCRHIVALIARYKSILGVIDSLALKNKGYEDTTVMESLQERKAKEKAEKAVERRTNGSQGLSGNWNAFKENKTNKEKEP